MESIHKNIINNTVPPLKALDENSSNHPLMIFISYCLVGLLLGSMTTQLVINTMKLNKHLAEQKTLKANGTK